MDKVYTALRKRRDLDNTAMQVADPMGQSTCCQLADDPAHLHGSRPGEQNSTAVEDRLYPCDAILCLAAGGLDLPKEVAGGSDHRECKPGVPTDDHDIRPGTQASSLHSGRTAGRYQWRPPLSGCAD